MTLRIVWPSEAHTELLDAQLWYQDVRLDLGQRFARAIEATVQSIARHPLQFPAFIEADAARECIVFRTEYFMKSRKNKS